MGADLAMLKQLYKYLVTFHLFPSILKAVLNMLGQLYRYLATFFLFPDNLGAFLNMVWNNEYLGIQQGFIPQQLWSWSCHTEKQLYRFVVTLHLFQSNLRAVLNIFGYDDYHSHSEIKQKGSNQDVKDKLIWFRLMLVSSRQGLEGEPQFNHPAKFMSLKTISWSGQDLLWGYSWHQ